MHISLLKKIPPEKIDHQTSITMNLDPRAKIAGGQSGTVLPRFVLIRRDS